MKHDHCTNGKRPQVQWTPFFEERQHMLKQQLQQQQQQQQNMRYFYHPSHFETPQTPYHAYQQPQPFAFSPSSYCLDYKSPTVSSSLLSPSSLSGSQSDSNSAPPSPTNTTLWNPWSSSSSLSSQPPLSPPFPSKCLTPRSNSSGSFLWDYQHPCHEGSATPINAYSKNSDLTVRAIVLPSLASMIDHPF